jgi:hypothetical protein
MYMCLDPYIGLTRRNLGFSPNSDLLSHITINKVLAFTNTKTQSMPAPGTDTDNLFPGGHAHRQQSPPVSPCAVDLFDDSPFTGKE